MKNMQWLALKILPILFGVLLLCDLPVSGQDLSHRLKTADSLFVKRQYTQSIEHYRQIFEQKQYTPAMFLKMAFIEEGLKNVGGALFYLNLYYLATQDPTAVEKMDALSKKHNLVGYQNTEATLAFSFYRNYHVEISFVIATLIFFLFSLAVYSKRRNHQIVPIVATVFVLVILFSVHLYEAEPASIGIVAKGNTYIMSGPSGGAPVKGIIQAGHRVEITGKKDVWIEIQWQNNTAYIRENLLLPVLL